MRLIQVNQNYFLEKVTRNTESAGRVSSVGKYCNDEFEALQNHTPDVMVIDEISRKQEVQAAKTVKFRGVRLVASAHGTFSELAQNPDLNGLLGGKNQVILSAKEAKHEGGRKTRVERAGSPVRLSYMIYILRIL